MKRITFLAVLAFALMVVVVPAMADTTFAWSGEIKSAFQTDFSTSSEAVVTANVTLGVTINDNLSFSGLIIATTNAAGGSTSGMLFNNNGAYYATMQLGSILGLDPSMIGEAVSIGNFDPGSTTYGASGIGNEGVFGADMGTDGNIAIKSVTTINNMINIMLAFDPGSFFGSTAQYLINAYGTFGPISASLGWGSNGIQGANVQFAQAMGDLGITAALEEQFDTNASTWKVGVGAKMTYTTLLTVGVGTNYGSAGLGAIGINVDLVPMTNFGADIWANILGGGAGIGYVDGSIWTKLDASTLRVGYVYTSSTGGYYVARLLNGGLYFTYDLTF